MLVSIVLIMTNYAYKKISTRLTKYEAHSTWSGFRRHMSVKLIVFKLTGIALLNISTFFAIKTFGRGVCSKRDPACDPSGKVCPLQQIGEQLVIVLVLDLTVNNFLEMFIPWLRGKFCTEKKGMLSTGSNESVKPEFDIAEEYLELLYRQFIVYIATMAIPMVGGVAIVGNALEFWLDKFRMLRITREPQYIAHSMRNFLIIYLTGVALFAIFVFPYGAFWILSGRYVSISSAIDVTKCAIFK